jgi:hypothetical protein
MQMPMMPREGDGLPREYVQAALAIEQHRPGFVDSYYGPPEWQAAAQAAGPRPLAELRKWIDALLARLEDSGYDELRRDFLRGQLRAMQMWLRLLAGERPRLEDEVEALYGVRPVWEPHEAFEAAQANVEALLPPGGTLLERIEARRRRLDVPAERVEPVLQAILAELRSRSRAIVELPEQESFELALVSGQPWGAYNWYLGNGRSRIDVNADIPLQIDGLVGLMAHEGYPGHHLERCLKDVLLYGEQGRVEHSVVVLNSPESLMAEGIATQALETAMTREALADWLQSELFPRAGFGHLDVEHELAIGKAEKALAAARANVIILLHEQGATPAEVIAYLQRWALSSETQAAMLLDFISSPLFRSYGFNYTQGYKLLSGLLDSGDRRAWFARLLREPWTPEAVRRWQDSRAGTPAVAADA